VVSRPCPATAEREEIPIKRTYVSRISVFVKSNRSSSSLLPAPERFDRGIALPQPPALNTIFRIWASRFDSPQKHGALLAATAARPARRSASVDRS
jgi:hypothetical protein